jgi:hypothetical protein
MELTIIGATFYRAFWSAISRAIKTPPSSRFCYDLTLIRLKFGPPFSFALLLALHLRRNLEASAGLRKGGLSYCCACKKEVKAWAAWAVGKRKEEKKKWASWGIWPKRGLDL